MRIGFELADMEGRRRPAPRARAAIREEVAAFKERALGGRRPSNVIGTERHESRRIDNQLAAAASGRQGDPGRSKFFLSLQDDLMRIFGSDRMDGHADQASAWSRARPSSTPGSTRRSRRRSPRSRRATSTSARTSSSTTTSMNDQRKVVFEQRREFHGRGLRCAETIDDMRESVVEDVVTRHIPKDAYPEQVGRHRARRRGEVWPAQPPDVPVIDWAKGGGHRRRGDARAPPREAADEAYGARIEKNTSDVMT